MTPERSKKLMGPKVALVVAASAVYAAVTWKAFHMTPVEGSLNALRALVVMAFVVVAWKDLGMLFRRPGRNMGTGLGRVYAVARTTMLEAWAGRVWLLPVMWLIASFILIFSVRPFDETERIPLYIKMLLAGQEILMLVIIWVMSSVSLPRERERKTLVTNASKPLSRLEIMLGKIGGFTAITAVTLAIMCVASLLILYTADMRLRGSAADAYEIQKRDFAKTLKTPDESLKALAEQGSLFAHNSITAAPDDMSIVGLFKPPGPPPDNSPAVRFIKGGSEEKIVYRFEPYLPALEKVSTAPPGQRPYFQFYFPVFPGSTNIDPIRIRVTATAAHGHGTSPARPQSRELTLSQQGLVNWEPDSPDDIFSYVDENEVPYDDRFLGEVTVEVQCLTTGALLQVLDGGVADPTTHLPPAGKEPNVACILERATAGTIPPIFWPDPNPRVRGFERHDRQEISGPKQDDDLSEFAVYRFPPESLRHVTLDGNGNFTLALNFETYRSYSPDKPTLAAIEVRSMDAPGQSVRFADQEVLEKRTMTLSVPGKALGDSDPNKRGDMYVTVVTETPGHSISLLEDSVRIELKPTPFFLNFMKGELVVLLEAFVLIAVCVACSIRLGWPVAMFCSSVVVAFGFMLDFLIDLQGYGGLGALNYRQSQLNPAVFKFFDSITGGAWQVLGVMARAVPNFTFFRYPQDYIPKLDNIPWESIGITTMQSIGFVLPVIAIGYLVFRKQELG